MVLKPSVAKLQSRTPRRVMWLGSSPGAPFTASYCTEYIASVGWVGAACERWGNMLAGATKLLTSWTSTGVMVESRAVGPRAVNAGPTSKLGQKSPATGVAVKMGVPRFHVCVTPVTPVKLVGVVPVYWNALVPPRDAVPDVGKPAVLGTGMVVAPLANMVPDGTSSRVARTGAVVSG